MKQTYNIGRFLQGEQFRLGIWGFYPSKMKPTFLIHLATAFNYLITFGQLATVVNFICSSTDLTKISEVLLISMTQVAFINKLVHFHMRAGNIEIIDAMLTDEVFTLTTPQEANILSEAFKKCQRMLNVFLGLCTGVVTLYGVFPATDNRGSQRKNYPLPGKFPFNPDDYYVVIYIMEVVAIAVSAWTNGSMDCLFTKQTVIATSLFEILCNKIGRLLDEDVEGSVGQRLKACAIYYEKSLDYVAMIQDTFSYGILIQFLCSAFVICLTGFQLMVVSFKSAQFFMLVLYFSCMVCQLTLYCWSGHMMMAMSDNITSACYSLNWNEMAISDQKTLMMIMERAKRSVVIKAGGTFTLNLPTLMAILRSSYSYFAVLQQIYSE